MEAGECSMVYIQWQGGNNLSRTGTLGLATRKYIVMNNSFSSINFLPGSPWNFGLSVCT